MKEYFPGNKGNIRESQVKIVRHFYLECKAPDTSYFGFVTPGFKRQLSGHSRRKWK
jgi:hypothetical protein